MSRDDRTKAVLELLNELEGLDAAKRDKRLLEINLEDHFAIQDHDTTLEEMKNRMDAFPCQTNSFLTFFSSLSKGKQLAAFISGAIFTIILVGGSILGYIAKWKPN
jgi:hypothetical protein